VQGRALLSAARTFAGRLDHRTKHSEQVRFLARALFDQLRDVHELSEDRGVLLEAAALLHDVGEVVNSRGHHKHGEYLIKRGRIAGLVGPDREMVALMARCHRKQPGRIRALLAASSLRKRERAVLRKLIGMLRLADGLDHEHRSRVQEVLCTRMGNAILLDVVVRDGTSTRDDADLIRKARFLGDELGLTVRITVGPATGVVAAP